MSLGWARVVLLAAGATLVVLVAMGKFGIRNLNHQAHSCPGGSVDPHRLTDYAEGSFDSKIYRMTEDTKGMAVTR